MALLSLDEDETELMDHLNAAKDVLGNPLYSPQFALRVARQRGSQKASVALLCQLNLFEVLKRSCPSAAMEASDAKHVNRGWNGLSLQGFMLSEPDRPSHSHAYCLQCVISQASRLNMAAGVARKRAWLPAEEQRPAGRIMTL